MTDLDVRETSGQSESEGSEDYSESTLVIVTPADVGRRLDVFPASLLPEQSRARLQRWVEEGSVLVDGRLARSSLSLRAGQRIEIQEPEQEAQGDWLAEPMRLDLLFEDDQVLVLNKPSGLVVHPAAGHPKGTLLNGLLAHCPELRAIPRAGIVHRLDRDTTGLMVVAKTPLAQVDLVRQLQARSVSRLYWALVWGRPAGARVLSGDIGRDPRDRQRMAVVSAGGKPAATHIEPKGEGVLEGRPVTLVVCRLETGRTHQIRVHLQEAGFPLVGDATYTRRAPLPGRSIGFERQALHAYRLSFLHPERRVEVAFEADLPKDFADLLERAGMKHPR